MKTMTEFKSRHNVQFDISVDRRKRIKMIDAFSMSTNWRIRGGPFNSVGQGKRVVEYQNARNKPSNIPKIKLKLV